MGVGGNFWDLLKPYARSEGFDYLSGKRVAVDLSYWIVQHETAIKARVRNPHLRLTFFRTINLFSKFGAFPVFVTDGTPSPLKSQARIARFFHASGIDLSSLVVPEKNASVERNATFLNCVKECVELLELFGMPVLKANGEAEALCAQLNSEGHVDACITADSDAFLFGAKSVIKCIRPHSKEPIECYNMADIEAGLGLKRNHLIAMSLLVGNDHDLNGVQGVGLDTALRFVQNFSENDVLTRLCQIGKGETMLFQGCIKSDDDIIIPCLDESSPKKKKKSSHCSLCGHPGSKRAHLKLSCEYCGSTTGAGCMEKPEGFRCECSFCDMDHKAKEKKKHENWKIRICNKIATEQNFPNSEIIDMYMCNNHYFTANDGPVLSWESPKTEMLVDYLVFHQHWEPSYIRQKMLPMLSVIYLREMASNPSKKLLYGQYEFDSIQRSKVRFGHHCYVIKWKKAASTISGAAASAQSKGSNMLPQEEVVDVDDCVDTLDESNGPEIVVDGGVSFLLTDENIELVSAAFPEQAHRFLQEKELRESKRKKTSSEKSESPNSRSIQLSITEFYRSAKTCDGQGEESSKSKTSLTQSKSKSKSARRRLLFS